MQNTAINHRIGFAHTGTCSIMKNFSLQQKRGGVGPVECRGSDHTSTTSKAARVDACKWAGSCKTGDAHITKCVVWAGIKGDKVSRCLPGPIR